MKRPLGKLAFAHAHLWRQGGFYRISLILGPAPLIGIALGAAIWFGIHAIDTTNAPMVPWAKVAKGPEAEGAASGPVSLIPWRPLPMLGSDGTPAGYTRGWMSSAHTVVVSPTLEVQVKPEVLAPLAINSAVVDMTGILADGPRSGLFVAVASGALVVRASGAYQMSALLDRAAGRPTQCVTRLVLGGHRIIWSLNVSSANAFHRSFEPITFDLKPGLYRLSYAFGCWDGMEMVDLGRLTVVMQRPGETNFMPIRPDEVVR